MADDTELVEKLLRLATDMGASEEEARTAALQAARVIKKKGLQVVPAGGRPPRSAPREYAPAQRERLLGVGTSELPGRVVQPISGNFALVNMNFHDDEPGKQKDFAFPQGLIRRG
jgi:hypothetical protein